jgi:hypothetical protein
MNTLEIDISAVPYGTCCYEASIDPGTEVPGYFHPVPNGTATTPPIPSASLCGFPEATPVVSVSGRARVPSARCFGAYAPPGALK